MKRTIYFLFSLLALTLFAAPLLSQCPIVVKCVPNSIKVVGDTTANNSYLWNDPVLWDAAIGTHDLAETPTNALSIRVFDECGKHPITIRCELYLDLDGDGVATKVFDSQSPSPTPGTLDVNGAAVSFDQRPVSTVQKYRFSVVLSGIDGNTGATLRWTTQAQPGQSVPVELPNGLHRVVWTATTAGNTVTCDYQIRVKDVAPPTVNCQGALSVNIMPTGMIQLWASDFLTNAADNITPSSKIALGLRKAGTGTGFPLDAQGLPQTIITFDCDELGSPQVEAWVKDVAGNTRSCAVNVKIEDNIGACTNSSVVARFCAGTGSAQFQIASLDSQPINPAHSMEEGCITLHDSTLVDSGFTITPYDDDNPLNGVTTYDLVLISKYIHGLIAFTPLQLVAADVNNDNTVTLADSVELRKLIVGEYTEFPNNTSWRFFAQNCLPDSASSLPPACDAFYTHLPGEPLPDTIYRFIAVKIGDVNASALANSFVAPDAGRGGRGLLSDNVPPIVNCLSDLSVNIMPTGLITLFASDFLASMSDNETPTAQIQLGLLRSAQSTGAFPLDAAGNPINSITFNCQELGDNAVQLWARDAAGNAAFCETSILVQDNLSNCNSTPPSINPCVTHACTNAGVPEVWFHVEGSSSGIPPFSIFSQSDAGGCTSFTNAIPLIATATITPFRDVNPIASTVGANDRQAVADHIAGTHPFILPWQWLAADVNTDGQINAADLALMDSVLQGTHSPLPWRFWPKDYVFSFPNPLANPVPSSITVSMDNNASLEFLGIPLGDVDACFPVATSDLNVAHIVPPHPNPTDAGATISLRLIQAETVRVTLTDISGKIMLDQKTQLAAGMQTVQLPANAFPSAGVYAWRVQAGDAVQAGKIVRM